MSSKQTPGMLDLNSIRHETNISSRLVPVLELTRSPRYWCEVRPPQSTTEKENGGGREAASATKGSTPGSKQSTINGGGRIPVSTSVPKLG